MAKRPTPARVKRAGEQLGDQVRTWRKLQGLTAAQLAERADITRTTLRRVEEGDLGVGLGVVLNVLRSLGQLDALVAATDPYNTDLGRIRSEQVLPQRVRSAASASNRGSAAGARPSGTEDGP